MIDRIDPDSIVRATVNSKHRNFNGSLTQDQTMAVSYNTVRDLAFGFPDVQKGITFSTPSLHVGRKLMARLREDGQTLATKLPMAEREHYFEQNPDTFFVTDHYRNYPMLLVDLPTVRREAIVELVEKAWQVVASARQLKAYDSALDEPHK